MRLDLSRSKGSVRTLKSLTATWILGELELPQGKKNEQDKMFTFMKYPESCATQCALYMFAYPQAKG